MCHFAEDPTSSASYQESYANALQSPSKAMPFAMRRASRLTLSYVYAEGDAMLTNQGLWDA